MRHRDIDVQQLGNRAHQAFGLAKRLPKHHAQRQTHLYRNIRIDRLAIRCRARWGQPYRKRVITDPNRQITTPPQAFVVLCAVGHPAPLLRDLVATISIELCAAFTAPSREQAATNISRQSLRATTPHRPRIPSSSVGETSQFWHIAMPSSGGYPLHHGSTNMSLSPRLMETRRSLENIAVRTWLRPRRNQH